MATIQGAVLSILRGHIFAPRPFTSLLTLGVLGVLLSLGRWQLHRADEKRILYDSFERGADATLLVDSNTGPLPRYRHLEMHGHYDESRQILVDNMTDAAGHAGYYVLTPFQLRDGAWLLVNRGWVPVGSSRAERPPVHVPNDERAVLGRADHLPTPGIRMGHPAPLRPPFPVVANFPTATDIAGLMPDLRWARAADSVLLDASQPDGYVRQWQAPGLPPLRHIAYAVQWFGLALALVVIYIVTNLKPAAKRAGLA